MELVEQKCNICHSRGIYNCRHHGILHQLKLLDTFQGKPSVEHITVVQHEWMIISRASQSGNGCKGSPIHDCQLFFKWACESRKTPRSAGQFNPIHHQRWHSSKSNISPKPKATQYCQGSTETLRSLSRPSHTPGTEIRCPRHCLIHQGNTDDTSTCGNWWGHSVASCKYWIGVEKAPNSVGIPHSTGCVVVVEMESHRSPPSSPIGTDPRERRRNSLSQYYPPSIF